MLDAAAVLDPTLGALKNFKLNIQIDHSFRRVFKNQEGYHFLWKNMLRMKFKSFWYGTLLI